MFFVSNNSMQRRSTNTMQVVPRSSILNDIFCQSMDQFSDGTSQWSGHEARVVGAELRLSQQAFSREKLEADWSSVLEVKPIRYGGAREMVMTMLR